MNESSTHRRSKKQIQIVETGERLFRQFGIKRVTVEEICAEAHVSKMTFYKYFKNKLELVKFIINGWFVEGVSKLDAINAMNIPATEKLRLMIAWKLEFIADMSAEFIEEYVHFDSELKKYLEMHYQKTLNRFLQYIIQWQKNGEVRPGIRPELILAYLNKVMELFEDDSLRNLYANHVEFTHELHSFCFFGIVSGDNAGK